MSNVIVLNMGLKSVRSIIFDNKGNKLASASLSLETTLSGDQVTQKPSEWLSKSLEVIKETLSIAKCKVDYITVTSSSSCLVCIDSNGNPLDDAIMVSDKRAHNEAIELANAQSFYEVKNKTGLGADPYLMLPKILWVKNNNISVYKQTYKFLSPNDFLIGQLSGKFITDYFNAQKYHYDSNTQSYPVTLLNELNIEVNKLPEVVSPGTIIGKMKIEIQDFLTIKNDVNVVVTTYDAICSFFGSGPSDEGDATDVSGTVTTFRVLSQKSKIDTSTKIFNQPFYDWGISIVGGSNNLGGGLIEWVKQCYYLNDSYPYEIMEKDARESELGANGLIFLPYLLGERAPIWDNNARGVFFGLERFHTRKDMTKAVFESAGFVIKDMIDSIEEAGVKVSNIRLSGGLARIGYISQLKADITGRDVLILDDFETTAIGAALLTFVGVKEFKNVKEASSRFVSIRMIIKPNQKNHEKYIKIHQLYKKTYLTLKDLFKDRQELIDDLFIHRNAVIENL